MSSPASVSSYKPIDVDTDSLPAELHPFFPTNEELVRRLNTMTAALLGVGASDKLKFQLAGVLAGVEER